MKNRLQELINEFGNGKLTVFAKKMDIPKGTFHAYLQEGAIKKTTHLIRFSERLGISIDWLLTGKGEKYLHKISVSENQNNDFKIINELNNWLKDICKKDEDEEVWFKKEIERKFPEFKRWKQKEFPEESETIDSPYKNVA